MKNTWNLYSVLVDCTSSNTCPVTFIFNNLRWITSAFRRVWMKADCTLHLIAVLKAAVQLYVVLQPEAEKSAARRLWSAPLQKRTWEMIRKLGAAVSARDEPGSDQKKTRSGIIWSWYWAPFPQATCYAYSPPSLPPHVPSTLFECRLQWGECGWLIWKEITGERAYPCLWLIISSLSCWSFTALPVARALSILLAVSLKQSAERDFLMAWQGAAFGEAELKRPC